MATWVCRWEWMVRVGLAGLLIGAVLGGCGRKDPTGENKAKGQASADPSGTSTGVDAVDPRLHQPFDEATVREPPADGQRPPDVTMTKKSIGKLYTDVVRLWDEVRFVAANGKRLHYRAVLDTELGDIEIALMPEAAPNHVRSFVALSRAGYYDGLVFERTIREQFEGSPGAKLELIEAGCPVGTGDAGTGSIGYWLKPEFNANLLHEEGTVGASRAEREDTAACKFYINLERAPFMDGNYTVFGRVTKGLNVARKILSLPVRNDPEFPEGDRPVTPVIIRKVTILVDEVDNPKGN